MIDFLLSVLSSIIGNWLTPSFKEWTGFKDDATKPTAPIPESVPDPADEAELEQRRLYVRRQWEIRIWSAFVYFVLILFVGTALTMPTAFKTGFFSQPLECATTLAANLCSGSYWEADAVKMLLIPLVLLFATVIWFLAQAMAHPIAHHIHYNHHPVDPIFYRRILSLVIMLLAFLLCGHWVYFLFPDYGYGMSIVLPFVLLGMVGAFASSRR